MESITIENIALSWTITEIAVWLYIVLANEHDNKAYKEPSLKMILTDLLTGAIKNWLISVDLTEAIA
jgi:hypothetical protein